MLILKNLSWSNCFSYGDNNVIDFTKNPLTQLMGPNGAGKTSIALIIQEVLYGKNNKNIKKQDIANNKTNKKGYHAILEFEKNDDNYIVELDRRTTLKFKLYKNGEDISSHTSLNTYKTLAEIIGVGDFKVFCQLIYQHSTDSLDFLTATDTNRKKFLISLLQLDRYLELHEHFKDKVRILNSEITELTGSINTIESWIAKHKDMDFTKHELNPEFEIPDSLYNKISELQKDLTNIISINRKIATNNEYKNQLNELDPTYYLGSAPPLPNPSVEELRGRLRVVEHDYNTIQAKISKLNKTTGECPECLQTVDDRVRESLINNEIIKRDKVKAKISALWEILPNSIELETEIKRYKKEKIEFERLSQLIDNSLPISTLNKDELTLNLKTLEKELSCKKIELSTRQAENRKIAAHNSKVDVIKIQLKEMKDELFHKNIALVEKENLMHILELLKKTFSTNGLVSYKIESSVKELEHKINNYLSELTHFQIYFKLAGEKLNIEVVDDIGNVTSISNLSSGERARVNIATILAIRNILSSLTSTKINLLFLDEVIGVIDAEGKEKLAEILLQENLNTFIVSHDWSHPLIPRINIVKEHHISRIEND